MRTLPSSIVGLALIYKVVPSAQVRWGAAAALIGVDLTLLSSETGHA